jgi:hypothetical protein
MKSRERVLMAMNFQEPDVVPVSETTIDLAVMEKILGVHASIDYSVQSALIANRKVETQFYDFTFRTYEKLDFDVLYARESLPDGYAPKKLPDGAYVDEIGRTFRWDSVGKCTSHSEPCSRRLKMSSIF